MRMDDNELGSGASIAEQSWQSATQGSMMARFVSLVDAMTAVSKAELQALADSSAIFVCDEVSPSWLV